MPMSHYPNGFATGIAIKGFPILSTYSGSVYWVDAATGGDGNKGSQSRPFATINKAVSKL